MAVHALQSNDRSGSETFSFRFVFSRFRFSVSVSFSFKQIFTFLFCVCINGVIIFSLTNISFPLTKITLLFCHQQTVCKHGRHYWLIYWNWTMNNLLPISTLTQIQIMKNNPSNFKIWQIKIVIQRWYDTVINTNRKQYRNCQWPWNDLHDHFSYYKFLTTCTISTKKLEHKY